MHPIWQSIYAGKWYSTHAKPLRQARLAAKQWCWQLNQLDLGDDERINVLKHLCPAATSLQVGMQFFCDYGFNIQLQGQATFGNRVVVLDAGIVKLGDNLIVGNDVVICALHHSKDACKRGQGLQRAEPINIGRNVTLGNKVTVLPGTVIPDNTNVQANQLVTRNDF
ncbi:maltose acetyltransferase domain-containing protein [Alteromonas ponticola]|uniref:Maltose/galactoside acetyltransferase domain-containing protein n=1 Tax=Alteromonas ponticola TaxID=2720613 RepID=A0ABX1QYZ7_9ALTE|nr:maltose acetyltransferase domain-containing protein [Alteromonas ponticola]NMH59448.1 hypothetical protein [Alteromonas ponticola]